MKNVLKIAAVTASLWTFTAHADVTLTYELNGPEMEPRMEVISLARFFARIDNPAEPNTYLVYQTGKFFPLYRVDQTNGTYTRLTPEVNPTLHAESTPDAGTAQDKPQQEAMDAAAHQSSAEVSEPVPATSSEAKDSAVTETETGSATQAAAVATAQVTHAKPASVTTQVTLATPATTLRLTQQTKEIAGVACRVVEELAGKQPVMIHCMADKARLGISEREIRSLARVFQMARERNFGWLGTATRDEKFVSVASEDLQSKKTLQLQFASTKPLPAGFLRIPREFKEVSSQ